MLVSIVRTACQTWRIFWDDNYEPLSWRLQGARGGHSQKRLRLLARGAMGGLGAKYWSLKLDSSRELQGKTLRRHLQEKNGDLNPAGSRAAGKEVACCISAGVSALHLPPCRGRTDQIRPQALH